MLLWQAILIGFLYYFSDAPFFFGEGYYVLQRPIVAGFLVGLVMGDPVQGTIIGATINLIFIGVINVGGSIPSDMALAGYAGTALALAAHLDTEAALALAVPLGLLGTVVWVGKMSIDSIFVHWADHFAEKGNVKGVMLMNWLPCQTVMFVFKTTLLTIFFMVGSNAVEGFLNGMADSGIIAGFSAIGSVLPALGIALNLRALLNGSTWPFLLIGFLLVAYFQIPVIGVAGFGLAAAMIYLLIKKENTDYAQVAVETEEAAAVAEMKNPLSKKDVQKSYWLWQLFSHANYNYERYQATSFAMSMAPIMQKLYKDNPEEVKAGIQRHLHFFNTDPNLGAMIHGVVISLEEKRANGASEITDDVIESTKVGLMGPFAGIGDSVIQGIIIPVVVAIGISFGTKGNLFGPLLVLFGLSAILVCIAYNSWMRGYELGSKAVTDLLSGGKMKNLMGAAGILGTMVMGALISSYVYVTTPITFTISGAEFALQSGLFDAIMPNLLPLLLTLGCYKILKKGKVSVLTLMVILAVVAFFGGMFGILA